MVTYGDDVLGAVKPEYIDLFNNVVYASLCKELYNMTFTPAAKTGELVPYMTIDEVSFLKRTFEKKQGNDYYFAPLTLSSVEKTISWVIPSKSVTEENQIVSACTSFMTECFFHCDTEDQYIELRDFVNDVLKEAYLGEDYSHNFKSFQELQEVYVPVQSGSTINPSLDD